MTWADVSWIGKLWTAGIAYVALAVGAGLSIMYNVVDTMSVRGPALDVYDVITAVAAPAIVVLMVEMFVSRIWVGHRWHIQILRWLATLVIGGVAMRTSWTHGHDFMADRGQTADVSTSWPLAIDLLAVMATALILAGRRVRGQTDTGTPAVTDTVSDVLAAKDQAVTDKWLSEVSADRPDTSTPRFVSGDYVRLHVTDNPWTDTYVRTDTPDTDTNKYMIVRDDAGFMSVSKIPADTDTPNVNGHDRWADLVDMDAVHSADIANLMSWADGARRADADIAAKGLADEASAYLRATVGELPKRTRPAGSPCPPEFADMVSAWQPDQLPRADMVKLSAAYFDVSTRTASRWLARLNNEPVSGPPSDEESE